MKKKVLVNEIKKQATAEMPDVLNKINLNNIKIDDYESESVKQPFNFKRALSYTFATLFVFVSGFMIYNFGYLSIINDANPLETETEIIGFQTVSAASILSVTSITELSSFDNNYYLTNLSQSTSTIEEQIDLINSYLNLAETVIGNEDNFVYNSINSDNPDYEYAFEYKAADLAGNLIIYQTYYNKETISTDGKETISGIMINNQKEYSFSSTVIQNGEDYNYQYRIYTNQNNYVEVTDTSTDNSQKFTYEVYKGGNLFNTSELTVHSYKNNINGTIEVTNRLDNSLTLYFSRNTSDFDNQKMNVKYSYQKGNNEETGDIEVNLIIDNENGEYKYQYRFNNSNIITANRSGKGNTKASKDDFEKVKGNSNRNTTSEINTQEDTTQKGNNTNSNDNTHQGNGNGHRGQKAKTEEIKQMEI